MFVVGFSFGGFSGIGFLPTLSLATYYFVFDVKLNAQHHNNNVFKKGINITNTSN